MRNKFQIVYRFIKKVLRNQHVQFSKKANFREIYKFLRFTRRIPTPQTENLQPSMVESVQKMFVVKYTVVFSP
jgi:hypothetical protein